MVVKYHYKLAQNGENKKFLDEVTTPISLQK
uniref:Uncharacterized protein n=1 Tax=Myoviridae sp. ctXwe21 TaxID=2825123 RepID=A0A8S5PXS8_9CAUD|nr:MAG TPA: hypothetical protein [Myoviridae sp. ctXwe21]